MHCPTQNTLDDENNAAEVVCNQAVTKYVAYNALDTSQDVSAPDGMVTATDKVTEQDDPHQAQTDENVEPFHVGDKDYLPKLETDFEATEDSAEFLCWHHRLNHLSFKNIRGLAALNLPPKRIKDTRAPKCACCVFGAMTKQGWRGWAKPPGLRKATKPGQVVFVDTVESSTPGLVAQLKGRLTVQR